MNKDLDPRLIPDGEYIDALNNSNKGIISFKMKYIERNWTTKEIFESDQYYGSYAHFSKTHKTTPGF